MSLLNYSLYCAAAPLHAYGCRDFWFYSMLTIVFLCLTVILVLFFQIYKEKELFKAYQLKRLERALIAEPEIMNQHKWKGDSEFDGIEQTELAEKMREKLRQRTKTNYNI